MKKQIAGLRLGVLLLFVIGLLSPVATGGAGAQDLTCDDFSSPRAAQAVLDADPSLEDALDPDGDGIACNEEDSGSQADDEETPADDEDTPVDDEETPAGDEDDDVAGGDEEAYLADIQDEVDSVVGSFDRFVEINTEFTDADEDEQQDFVLELEDLATSWSEYGDVASEFEAPAGFEDVEDAYLDFADLVVEAGDLWLVWWDIPQGDPEEDPAFDEFSVAFEDAYAAADDVTAAIEDAGGSSTTGDDPTEEPDGPSGGDADAEEYLAEVQDNADAWAEGAAQLEDLDIFGGSEFSDAEVADIEAVIEEWAGAPDTAAELEAPEGLEDVADLYLDLADEYATAADEFDTWLGTEGGSPEEADAEDAFQVAVDNAADLTDELDIAIEDAGGASPSDDPTDDPTEEPTDEPTEEPTDDPTDEPAVDADAEEYLETVGDTADDWSASVGRFTEIISLGADATDADRDELAEIITGWATAPDVAAELEAPAGLEDVQAAYEDYADELAAAAGFFTEWLGTEADTPEEEDAFTSFIDAVANSETLYAELQDLIADAG
jgi:hypothetical protein